MGKLPSGFATKEEYAEYMRNYRKRRKVIKEVKKEPLKEFIFLYQMEQ